MIPCPETLCLAALLLLSPPAAVPPETLSIPDLDAPVRIVEDGDGIAHLDAQTEHDLFFAQGFYHARNRIFQMDLGRRVASGTAAELLGPRLLGSDVEMRRFGLRRAAERSLPLLSPDVVAALEAYADGVNAAVERSPAVPVEYQILELSEFEPWTPVDTLAIGKLGTFGLRFSSDLGPTTLLEEYRQAGKAGGFDGTALFFDDLHRAAPFDPASTVPDALGGKASTPGARSLSKPDPPSPHPHALALMRRTLERWRRVPAMARILSEDEASALGSNAWAISGSLTIDGQPLLAADPHLGLDLPARFLPMHLRALPAGLDVVGRTSPGAPFVFAGHNQRAAWGSTSNPLDVTDTYEEKIVADPDSPSGLSTVHLGQLEPVEALVQVFRYNVLDDGVDDNLAEAPAGGWVGETFIPERVLIVPRRSHGPIVDLDPEAGVALSVQWSGFEGTRDIEAYRRFATAADLDEFIDGIQYLDTAGANFFYVDVDGRVAYFTTGEIPLREDLEAGAVDGAPPFLVRDGTGGNEWLPASGPDPQRALPYEILPFEEHPQVIDPPAGYVVNANNDPAGGTLDNDPLNEVRPNGGLLYLARSFNEGIRAGRINDALAEMLAAGPVDREQMVALQADTVLLDAQVFTPYLSQAFDNAQAPDAPPELQELGFDSRVVEAIGRLESWDFTTPTGVATGYDASDEPGELLPPSPAEREASVAATIYAVWRGRFFTRSVAAALAPFGLRPPSEHSTVRLLRHLLDGFAETGGRGGSGLDFFPVEGVSDSAGRRDIVLLESLSRALDLLAGPAFDAAFGGSTDQDAYRWGRLHRVVFDHPLGAPFSAPSAGDRLPPSFDDLPGYATDGGWETVDVATHGALAADSFSFGFGSGANGRLVAGPAADGSRISGRDALPGGISGNLASPLYVNLLESWLTNESFALRQSVEETAADARSVRWLVPTR